MDLDYEVVDEHVDEEEQPVYVKTKSKPSDYLNERIAMLRRIHPTIPSVDDLMKHAEKFGTECVLETAVELGYGLETCVRVAEHCDRLDVLNRERWGRKNKPKPAIDRCKVLLGIVDEVDEAA